MMSTGKVSKSRRVPPELRKRSALSCDFCRSRRRRCQKEPNERTCQLCKEQDVQCVSSLPQKQKASGPNEGVDKKCRSMEQAVRTLFPYISPNYMDIFLSLMKSQEAETHNDPGQKIDPMSIPDNVAGGWRNRDGSSVATRDSTFNKSRGSIPTQRHADAVSQYETMLRNSSGVMCYFGPSSSLGFFMKLRDMITFGRSSQSSSESTARSSHRDWGIVTASGSQVPGLAHLTNGPSQYLTEVVSSDHVSMDQPFSSFVQVDYEENGRQESFVGPPQLLKDILSSRRETEALLDLFFVHVHPNIPIIYRPTFQAAFEEIWQGGVSDSLDTGWAICITVATALGCEFQHSFWEDNNRPSTNFNRQFQQSLVHFALSKLGDLLLSPTLSSVQGLVVLSIYFDGANERNMSWLTIGYAIRMAVSLGLHRGETVKLRASQRLLPLEREIRRRTWWVLYTMEQFTCAILGRPSAMDEIEISKDPPQDFLMDEGHHRPPNLLKYDVQLAHLTKKIRGSQISHQAALSDNEEAILDMQEPQVLLQELRDWQNALPWYLKVSSVSAQNLYPNHLRQTLALQLRYHYTIILLTRPFLFQNLQRQISVGQNENPSDAGMLHPVITAFSVHCVQAAIRFKETIQTLWDNQLFDGKVWLDGVLTYQCGLVLMLSQLTGGEEYGLPPRQERCDATDFIVHVLHKANLNKTVNRLVELLDNFATVSGIKRIKKTDTASFDSSAGFPNPDFPPEINHAATESSSCVDLLTQTLDVDSFPSMSTHFTEDPSGGDTMPRLDQNDLGFMQFFWNMEDPQNQTQM